MKLELHLKLTRELYNGALQERRDAYRINGISLNYYDQANQLASIKDVNDDYTLIHSQILQDVLKRVDKAYKSFFRRVKTGQTPGFPRFKGKHYYNSFCYPQSGFNLEDDRLTLSKIGQVKIKLSRSVTGKIKTCTIRREIDKWYTIFTVETIPEILEPMGTEVGLDLGLSSFATLSTGEKIDNLKSYQKSLAKLRLAQRRVARRHKGSNRRRKAVVILKKIHQAIKNQRQDFLHKTSTNLIKNYDLICIEDLNFKSMMADGQFNKAIHDASWNTFTNMLSYKAENAGRKLVKVNPQFTSQDCSDCSSRVRKELSKRTHKCLKCGLVLDRDHNAAINILRAGYPLLAETKTIRL